MCVCVCFPCSVALTRSHTHTHTYIYTDNLTIFSHSLIGGAFGYVLSRALYTRLPPSPRLFAVVSFTGFSSVLAATAATTIATADLVKKALPYTEAGYVSGREGGGG